MKTFAIAIVALASVLSAATAAAQGASFGNFGMLAMNSDGARNGLGNTGLSALVESTGDGGGASLSGAERGSITAGSRGGDSVSPADVTPKATQPFEDPSQPAAQTPRRPSYRWQSLVPGAIK